MAILFFTGIETGSTSEFASISGSSVVSSPINSGAYSLRLVSGTGTIQLTTGAGPFYIKARIYIATADVPANRAASDIITMTLGGTATNVSIQAKVVSSAVTLNSKRIATLGSDQALSVDAWHTIEVKFGPTAGTLEWLFDGSTIDTVTGITYGSSTVSQMKISGPSTLAIQWDDVVIRDDAYHGTSKVIARQPVTGGATPTYDAWNKSTGTDAGALWDNTPFDATDSCNSGSVTTAPVQTAVLASFGSTQTGHGTETIAVGSTINAAKIQGVGKTSATTSSGANFRFRRRAASADTDASLTSLTTSDTLLSGPVFSETLANLNAMEVGVAKDTTTQARTQTFEDIWVQVDYTTAGATAYTLTSNVGGTTLAGVAATVQFGHHIVAAVGGTIMAGVAASVVKKYPLIAAVGNVPIAGAAAVVKWDHRIAAALGTTTLAGLAAQISKGFSLTANVGDAPIAGVAAALKWDHRITAAAGAMVAAGQAATLQYGRHIVAAAGATTLDGVAAALRRAYPLTASLGTATLDGVAATLTYTPLSAAYMLTADVGAAVVAGVGAALRVDRSLTASVGATTLNGIAATLRGAWVLPATVGTATLNGIAATLTYVPAVTDYVLTAEPANVGLVGSAAQLLYTPNPIVATGATPGFWPQRRKKKKKVEDDEEPAPIRVPFDIGPEPAPLPHAPPSVLPPKTDATRTLQVIEDRREARRLRAQEQQLRAAAAEADQMLRRRVAAEQQLLDDGLTLLMMYQVLKRKR